MNLPAKQIQKKLHVGWFTFSCCEDSTIIFTELMNDHWKEWKRVIDFRHARVLKKKNVLDELDIAFIEGAITSQEHIDKLKRIRERSNMLVAIGACAIIGMPSAQRNRFSEDQLEDIEPHLARFEHLDKVMTVKDIVSVDEEVPGCPMDPDDFMKIMESALKKFNIS